MPELPEVETTLRGVARHVEGRTIAEVDVRERRLRWPVARAIDALAGTRVEAVRRRGKYLLFETGRGTLVMHLGMSGSLRVTGADAPWRKHDHLALRLDSGRELRFHDPRRFGCVLLVGGDPARHPLLADLGPEPLGDAFTAAYLSARCQGRAVAIKQLVMNSRIVVGIGNIYACETLFLAGIHPARAAGRIAARRASRLVESIRQVLGEAIGMGGTTLRDFVREDGEPGYFKSSLRVYDREGQPCVGCGRAIRRVVQANRATYYCAKCQR